MDRLLLRSCLFVPATRSDFIAKASAYRPDAVFLDLEDSIPNGLEKSRARAGLTNAVSSLDGVPAYVRINDWDSGLLEQDALASVRAGAKGLVVPKVMRADDIRRIDALLNQASPAGNDFQLIVIVETAGALLRLDEIAGSSPRIVALALGSEDLFADLQVSPSKIHAALAGPRHSVVVAARANGRIPIDTVFTDFHDSVGLEASLRAARDVGMAGMMALHPTQIPVANDVFSPTQSEIDWARKVVELSDRLAVGPQGVGVVDGEFVGPPIRRQAKQILHRDKLREAKTSVEFGPT